MSSLEQNTEACDRQSPPLTCSIERISDAQSLMGQQQQAYKEMIEVTSPLKQRMEQKLLNE